MLKITKIISGAVLVLLLSGGCTKENLTSLNLTVVNASNNPVSNADVVLYSSQSDLAANNNPIDVQITDVNGNVTFENLGANIYYFNILRSSDCYTNAFTTSATATLNSGKANSQTVTVKQIGEETFNNTSSNAYNVTINATSFQTINGNSSVSANLIVGTYAIQFIPVSAGIEKDTTISVNACQTSTLNFP